MGVDVDLGSAAVATGSTQGSRLVLRSDERPHGSQGSEACRKPEPVQQSPDSRYPPCRRRLGCHRSKLLIRIVFPKTRGIPDFVFPRGRGVGAASRAARGKLFPQPARIYVWIRAQYNGRRSGRGHGYHRGESVLLEWIHLDAITRQWWNAALRTGGEQALLATDPDVRSGLQPDNLHSERFKRRSVC